MCDRCWEAVAWVRDPLCARCGSPTPVGARCPCDARPAHVSAIAWGAPFAGPLRHILHALKYSGHQSLGAALASRLRHHPHLDLDAIDIVVPVPLHPSRRLRRGYNQAERIARHLGPPVVHALARPHWTRMQAGLTASERRRNVRDAFALASRFSSGGRAALRGHVRDGTILLVDDVMTTGGTLSACARVLREAGAREVRALTAARTL